MLCFDPTRGIDIRHQAPDLRAAARPRRRPARRSCSTPPSSRRSSSSATGRSSSSAAGSSPRSPSRDADEPTLLRAAYNLPVGRADARGDRGRGVAEATARRRGDAADEPPTRRRARRMTRRGRAAVDRRAPDATRSRVAGRGATPGRSACSGSSSCSSSSRSSSSRATAPTGIQGLAIAVLPLALAAVAQAIVVISGGIDLSIGSMMALTSVIAAVLMKGQSEEFAVAVVIGVLAPRPRPRRGQRRRSSSSPACPTSSSRWRCRSSGPGARCSSCNTPGGGAADWLKDLVTGPLGSEWIPKALVVLLVVVAVDLDPAAAVAAGPVAVRHRQQPAGGVPQRRRGRPDEGRRLCARRACSRRSAGSSLTASTGIGTPVPGAYTLLERRRGRPRRRQPRRRPRRRRRARSSRSSSSQLVRTDLTFLRRRPQPRDRRPGRRSSSASSCSAASSQHAAGARHERRRRHGRAAEPVADAGRAGGACSATGRSSRCSACSCPARVVLRARPARASSTPTGSASTLRAAVPLAILAGCQTLTMLTGGIDLSVGDGRLDGGVRHGHPVVDGQGRGRRDRRRRSVAAALVGPRQRRRRRRLPGPPADHDPGHGPGRPRARRTSSSCTMVQTGVGRPADARAGSARTGARRRCPTASSSSCRWRR